MRYNTYYESTGFALGGRLTPAVKYLIISCAASFLLQELHFHDTWTKVLGLTPVLVNGNFFIWQFFTYLFLHGGIWHLLFNMFALWMFGGELERSWGTREFVVFYFITGVGVGLIHWALATGGPDSIFGADYSRPLIGSSGAIFGLLAAYGLCFPERRILFMLLFPMKAKWFVLLLAAIELYLCRVPGSIAHFAHLSGMLIGWLYLKKEWNLAAARFYVDDLRRRRKIKLVHKQEDHLQQERDEVDRILDKINREGIQSLSRRELKILHRASSRTSSGNAK
ncbi:MAG: rhomboid family intramembrane serine protease [Candidatus Glassbacteria bacterium]|nr:rhomboid family intramembrane serine protease [Candidatus Glassbacteria bacterium]